MVQLARADVPIRGRLLNGQGQPLVGARVRPTRLAIPANHDLTAYLERATATANSFELDSQSEIIDRFSLPPGISPVVTTDQDGRFTLTGVGDDRVVRLNVVGPGVISTDIDVMTRAVPDIVLEKAPDGVIERAIRGADFTAQPRASCSLSGVVRDQDTHQPIPGMFVGPGVFTAVWTEQRHRWIFNDAEADPQVLRYEPITPVRTDANGRFTLTGLDPRRLVPQPPPQLGRQRPAPVRVRGPLRDQCLLTPRDQLSVGEPLTPRARPIW